MIQAFLPFPGHRAAGSRTPSQNGCHNPTMGSGKPILGDVRPFGIMVLLGRVAFSGSLIEFVSDLLTVFPPLFLAYAWVFSTGTPHKQRSFERTERRPCVRFVVLPFLTKDLFSFPAAPFIRPPLLPVEVTERSEVRYLTPHTVTILLPLGVLT